MRLLEVVWVAFVGHIGDGGVMMEAGRDVRLRGEGDPGGVKKGGLMGQTRERGQG